jgi:hypothetical protein
MTKEKIKKITFADVLKSKGLEDEQSTFYSDTFGGEIDIDTNIDNAKILRIMSMDNDVSEFERECELIYNCCELFRHKELVEKFDVAIPYMVVAKMIRLAEVNDFSNFLLQKFGFIKLKNELKNA